MENIFRLLLFFGWYFLKVCDKKFTDFVYITSIVSHMLCTWDAVCDDCGPNMAATPVFIKWQTRFDAWKLSCGRIRSISAWSFERGKILLSALIFSTAYLNAISCGSVVWWSSFDGSGAKRPPVERDLQGFRNFFSGFWLNFGWLLFF